MLSDLLLFDAHCDTVTRLSLNGLKSGNFNQEPHNSIGILFQLAASGRRRIMQAFALCMHPFWIPGKLPSQVSPEDLVSVYFTFLEQAGDHARHCTSRSEAKQAWTDGKIACFLTIEGLGEAAGTSIERIIRLYELGVRWAGPVWNHNNSIAAGVDPDQEDGGLTAFGKTAVDEMERLGMGIDVSHMSDKSFWDCLERIRKRGLLLASHSNARALCGHRRNLTDAQIRAVSAAGGVIGITFHRPFLNNHSANASISDILAHIDHIAAVGGIQCVGIGSDFDGTDELACGIRDASDLPLLVEQLLQHNYSEEDIRLILGGNWLRIFSECRM